MGEEMLLTFEIRDKDQIEIHMNEDGAKELAFYLQRLTAKDTGLPEHEHLMVPSWGGHQLTEEKQCEDNSLIKMVTIFFWPTK